MLCWHFRQAKLSRFIATPCHRIPLPARNCEQMTERKKGEALSRLESIRFMFIAQQHYYPLARLEKTYLFVQKSFSTDCSSTDAKELLLPIKLTIGI